MKLAAERTASLLARDFGELENLQSSRRGFKSFVAAAGARSEERIIRELSKARPVFTFLCESHRSTDYKHGTVWVVDPICGINNFARGIPQFTTNIAIMEGGGVIAGLTLDPMRGDCFISTLGGGSFVGNRNRLRVSGREELEDSIAAVNAPQEVCNVISQGGARLRCSGAVALDLAYLAAGKCDVAISHGVRMWNIASGILLLKEAGGFMEFSEAGDGTYNIIAASSLRLLKEVKSSSA